MIPSVTDVCRALSDCRASFGQLADMTPQKGASAVRTSMFAEFVVEWRGESWLLCTPLGVMAEAAIEELARMAVRLKRSGVRHVAEYRVFHSELRFYDSAGGEHTCDVVMQRIPEGISLACATPVVSHKRLLDELDDMQNEFRRIGFVHNNLKPDNVIITDDKHLVAVRCHFAHFGETSDDSDGPAFEALRRLVVSKPLADNASDDCPQTAVVMVAGCEVVGSECEQRIRICRNGLVGFADAHGEVIIEPQFDEAEDFREGRAEIKVNGRMGLIDKQGNYVIAPCYEYLEYRDDCGISLVRSEGVWSAFGYDGNPLGIRHENVAQLLLMLAEKMNVIIEI